MKTHWPVVVLLGLVCLFTAAHSENEESAMESKYDEALAAKLGADKYGMRRYVLVTLLTGSTAVASEEEGRKIFSGHMANIQRLADEGKLAVAGPFLEGGAKRGLFIFAVETVEEADSLVRSDPAVQAGIFTYELTKWYGSAALMQVNGIHQTIQTARP